MSQNQKKASKSGMAVMFNEFPDEIFDAITEECGAKELLALSRTSKRLSRISLPKVYRHVYYRYNETSKPEHSEWENPYLSDADSDLPDTDGDPSNSDNHSDDQNLWKCGRCYQKCSDGVFDNKAINPFFTQIVNLPKFAETISQYPDKRRLVSTVRLDLQSLHAWGFHDFDGSLTKPHTEMWRWSLNSELEGAINSITNNLNHLPLSRAHFLAECCTGCHTPRVIQTMGISLPFILLIPDYAIETKQLCNPTHLPTEPKIYDIATALNFDIARIDHTSQPPQILEIEDIPISESCATSIYHYTGPTMDLGDLLGAPRDFNSYQRWLAGQPPEAFQTNSIKAAIMRQLREHFGFLEKRYEGSGEFKFDQQVIGDFSNVRIDEKSVPKTGVKGKGRVLPENILLNYLTLDLEGYE